MTPQHALIVIDIQNDFCEGGALSVPDGSAIVAGVNALMNDFDVVVLSQDWHPADHSSFASMHENQSEYDLVDMAYGPQVLWPDHCVQGTQGAQFHPNLHTDAAQLIVRKGYRRAIDSYSAFFENDRKTPTGLHGALQNLQVTDVTFVGLAYDFCVQFSAIDAATLGYKTTVVASLCKAIDLNGSKEDATRAMKEAGVALK